MSKVHKVHRSMNPNRCVAARWAAREKAKRKQRQLNRGRLETSLLFNAVYDVVALTLEQEQKKKT